MKYTRRGTVIYQKLLYRKITPLVINPVTPETILSSGRKERRGSILATFQKPFHYDPTPPNGPPRNTSPSPRLFPRPDEVLDSNYLLLQMTFVKKEYESTPTCRRS